MKKDTYKPENIHITLFIVIIFKSNNIYQKHTHKPQNISITLFTLKDNKIKKAYLHIPKNPAQFFAYTLFQILKKHTYKF